MIESMPPDSLSQMLSGFLKGARAAVVVEDGAIAFDLDESKYSISGEYHKCLLHLWSRERNFVRRVLDAEVKATTLRLQVQRMGQNRPTRLDFCRDRDQRSPAARRAARSAYEPRLRRALERNFPGWTVGRLTTSADLEHSFGPAAIRLFSRTRDFAPEVSTDAGRSRPACASHHRHNPSLPFAGDRLGSAGNRRALAGTDPSGIPEEADARVRIDQFKSRDSSLIHALRFRCSFAASPVVRDDKHCDRPAAASRAILSVHHPTGSWRRDRFPGRRQASPSSAGPS